MKFGRGFYLFALLVVVILAACSPTPTPAPTATSVPEPEEAEPASETLSLTVATDAAFPPMEFVDENKDLVGFDMDLLNAIAERQDMEITYKNTAWDGIFAGLESGDYDAIISAVTILPEREEKYDFTDPYINAGQAIVVTADETEIAGEADLSGRVVGAQIGTTGATAVENTEGAELKEYDTIDLAFLDLVNGNVEAVVVDTPVAADFALTSDQFEGKLKIVGEPLTEEYYGALVRKGENAKFISRFNDGLAQVKEDGTYDEIYNKWISGEGTSQTD